MIALWNGILVTMFQTDSLGKIVDLRNHDNAPTLQNLSKMNSTKIKELCRKAYTKQMEELLEAEGEGKLYRSLKSELQSVERVDCEKADREGKKFVF